jgi:hypothetical protein
MGRGRRSSLQCCRAVAGRGAPRSFAYVAIAVYAAVMAVEGGYEPFAVDIDAPGGASSEAAVAAAARRVLVHYLPGQAASIIEPAYESSLATIPDGQAEMDGVATGDAVATRLIELRAGDGFRAPVTYTPPNHFHRSHDEHPRPRRGSDRIIVNPDPPPTPLKWRKR